MLTVSPITRRSIPRRSPVTLCLTTTLASSACPCFSRSQALVVTSPFLFAVMFGDVGHATLLLLFTCFMIYREKEWSKVELPELLQFPFDGRYVILLMSIAGMYMGNWLISVGYFLDSPYISA